MFKITGYLHGGYVNSEGVTVQPQETLYARNKFTLKLKTFYLQLFYDSISEEIVKNSKLYNKLHNI